MKGKKFIAIISIVCILAVVLCFPAFATVTESNGDGYALYGGCKLPNIDTVWTDKVTNPYACLFESGECYVLCLTDYQFVFNGVDVVKPADNYVLAYMCTFDSEFATIFDIPIGVWSLFLSESVTDTVISSYMNWSNYDIINSTNSSVYLAASNPISLDGYNLIEWDGDTSGLEYFDTFSSYALTTGRIEAVDAFAVMNLSYSQQPVVIDGFVSLEDIGWYVEPPTSSYMFSCSNALVEPAGSSESYYATIALKFDDVDDTGYTSLIAYRTVEAPPDEGGGTEPDDPQPPFRAAEI